MPATVQALGAFVVFVLPGALYVLVREWRLRISNDSQGDRIVRFLMASSVFHIVGTSWLIVKVRNLATALQANDLSTRQALLVFVWLVLLAVVPALLGYCLGTTTTKLDEVLLGSPEDVWQLLRSPRTQGNKLYLRARIDKETWVVGIWGEQQARVSKAVFNGARSTTDLYLAARVDVDPSSGGLRTATLGGDMIVPGESIDFVEVVTADGLSK